MATDPATIDGDAAREKLERLVRESLRQRRDDQLAEAEGTLRRALELAERAWGRRSPQSALVLADLGRCRVADGRFEAAEAAYRQALDIERGVNGAPSLQVGVLLHDLAVVCEALGRESEATELWAEGRALFEQKEQAGT